MNLTRRLRSLLAGPRHGATAVVAAMFLVLSVMGVHVMCGVHLDEHPQGVAQADDGQVHGAHDRSGAHTRGVGGVRAATPGLATVQAGAVESLSDGSSGCSDHDTATEQSDPLRPPSPPSAAMPAPAVVRLVPAAAHRDHRTASGVVATAPSLHALGISRT